jgi:predicted AAA+ superfamily ATPase
MINRQIREHIERSLNQYPVVGILGPRQIGKTTLAKTITEHYTKKVVYLDLELPSDLNKLHDSELYLSQFFDALVIIDEIQRMPSLFPLLRALVDKRRISGRFLILGSASPDLIRHASESLAGRIIYHELSPFHLNETGYGYVQNLWLRGGFPLSYLAQDEESFVWREAFIKTYLEMDIPQLGFKIPSFQLRRFWTMLAHSHGQLWNASHLAKSLGISAPTVRTYLDILEETFVVRRLQPYHINIKKRLIKSPKVYIRDSGLLHALLSIRTLDDLQSHPSVGSSWEGFVIEQIIGFMENSQQVYFYRTNAGAEIDLLLFDRKNRPIAVEIKYSASPKVEKGYWIAYEDLSCKKGFIVYPGNESYPLGKNVFALPLKDLEIIFE